MATTTTTANTDLPRQPSLCSSLSTLLADLQHQDMYSNYPSESGGGASMMRPEDEVWEEGMTLEDFLTKAGAVREEDVKESVIPATDVQHKTDVNNNSNISNGIEKSMNKNGERRYNKRRCGVVVEEVALDKATQQKQRRMIKNRESAARSRERKQAYTIELESLVTQLEEENARLRREEVEQSKKRYKELMENLIPVVDKRRPQPPLPPPPPPRLLRRVNSVQW